MQYNKQRHEICEEYKGYKNTGSFCAPLRHCGAQNRFLFGRGIIVERDFLADQPTAPQSATTQPVAAANSPDAKAEGAQQANAQPAAADKVQPAPQANAQPAEAAKADGTVKKKPTAERWIAYAVTLEKQGKLNEALAAYNNALEIEPANIVAIEATAAVLLGAKNYQQAVHYFYRALDVSGDNIFALNGLGLCFLKLGRFNDAMDCFSRILEIDPENANALINKGIVFKEQDRTEDAILFFDKVLKNNPSDEYALMSKGNALAQARYFEDAIACFNKAIEIDPTNALAIYNKGEAYKSLGKVDIGNELIADAVKMNPRITVEITKKKGNSVLADMKIMLEEFGQNFWPK